MRDQAKLVGTQYNMVSSSGYWAQLALCCGPTAFLIVKVPTRILLTVCLGCWGLAMVGLAFSKSYGPLLANRFLLGLFEAIAIPLFTVITTTWYRRREQPLRIAMWYGTNGIASMLGSLLTWALSFIKSPHLFVYQILFLTVGLATVLTVPLVWIFLNNNPAEARFLTPEERRWAIERLRDNNTGVETKEFKWKQVLECFTSPPIWFFFCLTFCINTGASVTNTFGPLIIKGFGFNPRQTILLNIPFGFVQTCVCFAGCLLAARFGYKGIVLMAFMIPCVIGSGLLYGLGRSHKDSGPLLFGYYLIAFLFGGNPLLFSWLAANTAGHTKKSLAISMCNAGSAVGNIVGPFLFKKQDEPAYRPGIAGVLGIFVATMGLSAGLMFVLLIMNRNREKERVANGKPAKLHNASMDKEYTQNTDSDLGKQAFADLTDRQNDEFVYGY
jgi:MFS family permease